MQPLHYEATRSARPRGAFTLAAVPLVTLPLLFWVLVHNGEQEPFGTFTLADAAVQVGVSAAVIGLWAWWIWVAFTRPGEVHDLVPLALLWGVINVLVAAAFMISYFNEHWNW